MKRTTQKFDGIKDILSNGRFWILLIILVSSFLVRLSYFDDVYHGTGKEGVGRVNSDEITYLSHAQILQDQGIIAYLYNEKSVEVPLFHTFYLAACCKILKGVENIRLLNIVLSVVSLWLIYKISSLMFGYTVAVCGLVLSCLNNQYIAYSSSLLTEPSYIFFLLSFLYFFLLDFNRGKFSVRSILAILFLVLAALTRSIAFLLPLYLLLIMFFYNFFYKRNDIVFERKNYWVLVVSLLFIMSFIVKNFVIHNLPNISTGSGTALWLGCRLDTEGDEPPYRGLPYGTKQIASGGDVTKMVRCVHLTIEGDRRLKDEGMKIIKNSFPTVFLNDIKKIRRLLTGTSLSWFYPYKNFYDWRNNVQKNFLLSTLLNQLMPIILVSFVSVFGVTQMFRELLSSDKRVVIFYHSIWYFVFISLPFLVNMRYGLPIILLLSVIAPKLFFDLLASRQWLRISALFLLVLASVLSIVFGTSFD